MYSKEKSHSKSAKECIVSRQYRIVQCNNTLSLSLLEHYNMVKSKIFAFSNNQKRKHHER